MTRTATAGCDGNFVLTADGAIVEAQVTAEGETFDEEGLLRLLRLARIGCSRDFRRAVEGGRPMRPIGDKLVIATHNPGKLREIAALLAPLGIACVGAEELGLPEPEEIGNTLRRQCRSEGARGGGPVGLPALADDSGLCVDALHGRPGIFSARWAEDEDGKRDWMRAMERVWREVEAAGPDAGHDAHFACALALAWPNDGQTERFEGRVDGTLVWPPRGDRGFGYDPMFVPVGHEQTFGEMDPERKAPHQPPRRGVQQASRRALAAGWRAARKRIAPIRQDSRPCCRSAIAADEIIGRRRLKRARSRPGRRRPDDLRVMARRRATRRCGYCRGTRRAENSAPPRSSRRP